MKNNRKYARVFVTLLAMLLLTCIFTTAAYAQSNEPTDSTGQTNQSAEVAPAPETTLETTPAPLTPDGQMTLVDDVSSGQAQDKQFLTVVTKNGNYFYIVIDKAGSSDNVYFLNLVDESDLLPLIKDDTVTSPVEAVTSPATGQGGSTAQTAASDTVQSGGSASTPDKTAAKPASNMSLVLGIIVILALIGGGVFFYIKVLKPKKSKSGGKPSELDDFDFDDDDDELDGLPYAEDTSSDDYAAEPEEYTILESEPGEENDLFDPSENESEEME